MPVLRSQRSKPSNQKEEEMPPPTVPRTRSTRSKNLSKQEKQDKPSSPAPSTSSTRTTRAKNRSKAVVLEEVNLASPPSTRSTRSTKQKAGTNKSTKSKDDKQKENKKIDPLLDPVVQLSPLAHQPIKDERSGRSRTAGRKGNNRPQNGRMIIESSTDDFTEEESDVDIPNKDLSAKQLREQHLLPLKTALEAGFCDAYTRHLAKMKDETVFRKQEEDFQRLLASKEMPPPAAPVPRKGRGRPKRARSPEVSQTKLTKVPESFDFTGSSTNGQVPAKKKMIMDQPNPESSGREIEEPGPVPEPQNQETLVSVISQPEPKVKDGKTKKKKIKKDKDDTNKKKRNKGELVKNIQKTDNLTDAASEVVMKNQTSGTETKKQDEIIQETNYQMPTGDENKNMVESKKEMGAVKKDKGDIPVVEQEEKTEYTKIDEDRVEKDESKADRKTNNEEEMDIFEQSTVGLAEDESVIIVTNSSTTGKESSDEIKSKKTAEKPVAIHDKVALNATYVHETPKDKERVLNTTFSPELFTTTPNTCIPNNATIVIGDQSIDDYKTDKVLSPPSPEESRTECTDNAAANSAAGKVSSLVNFFDKDKSKKELESKKGSTVWMSSDRIIDLNKTHSISPDHLESTDKTPVVNDMNATYVLPPTTKSGTSSQLNVTVCMQKSVEDTKASSKQDDRNPKQNKLEISVAPSFLQKTNHSRFMPDSPASRTFVKEIPSLAVVMEEDDDNKESRNSNKSGEKARALGNLKPTVKEKEKGISSSSSSSCSSMKSATSQPCLATSKNLVTSATKTYGSSGKINEISKAAKALEDAEKRRQAQIQQKIENSKKKNAEWSKKTEKNKQEEEKRMKEKQKLLHTAPLSAPGILKKPAPIMFGKTTTDSGFAKPKLNFGPSTKMPQSAVPPLSKNPFHKPMTHAPPQPPPAASVEGDMEDSFKSAVNGSSFLDQTMDGHLSSYDITVYEDLDEELKHRENKTVPHWASDKVALHAALFSMVLLPDYQHKLNGGFPKPDKSYKLFPTKPGNFY